MRGQNSLEELAQLQREVAELARQIPADDPTARYEGKDSSRTVRVEVDSRGVVHEVAVGPAWRRHLAGEELGPAVQEAIQDALVARTASWSEALGTRPAGGDRSGRPDPVTAQIASGQDLANTLNRVAGNLNRDSGERALHELLTVLEQVDASLDSTQATIDAHLARRFTGRTRHVTVDVTVTNEVSSIEYDEDWPASAHDLNIGREIRDALRQAYQEAAAHSLDKVIAETPFGRIQSVANDPVAWAERLGLRHGG